jgi:HlyD family secretion protein
MKPAQLILPLVALGGLAYAAFSIATTQPEQEFTEPVLAPPQSTFAQKVAAVGLVEPSSEAIQLGSARSGIVAAILVKAGDAVKKDQPLLRLRTDDLEAELQVAIAAVQQAEAQLEAATAQAESARTQIDVAVAEQNQAKRSLEFVDLPGERRFASKEEVSQRRAQLEVQVAKARTAAASLAAMEAGIGEAKATLATARARCAVVQNELARCTLRAPMDATVLQVRIRVGEYLGGDPRESPWLTLGETAALHVRADVDEHEAWKVSEMAPAEAQVRGNPHQKARLIFVRFEPFVIPKRSLTGDATERVDTRVLQVIYRVDPASPLRLFAGQQMDVFIEASDAGTASNR